MPSQPTIIAFSGSSRRGSFNKKALEIAVQGARDDGAKVTVVDLRDFEMPIYDGDLETEKGLPDGAKKLKALVLQHNGFLIASPEYNSSLPPLLKNAIDWISRPSPGVTQSAVYSGKVAAIVTASPGVLGGFSASIHLRGVLNRLGVQVLANQVQIPKANDVFGSEGGIKDSSSENNLKNLGAELSKMIRKLF